MGGSESKEITKNEVINKLVNDVKPEIINIQKTINDTVKNIVNDITQEISKSTSSTDLSVNNVSIEIGDIDFSDSACVKNNSLISVQNDINFKNTIVSIQNSMIDGKLIDKLNDKLSSVFSNNSDISNNIGNNLQNVSESILKAVKESGIADIIKNASGSSNTTETNNTSISNITNKIAPYIENKNEINKKLTEITKNKFKQLSKSSCSNYFSSDNVTKIKLGNIKNIKCGMSLADITNNVSFNNIIQCVQIDQISNDFIKELGLYFDTLNDNNTTQSTKTDNIAKNDQKATSDIVEKDATAEVGKSFINNIGDVVKSGINMFGGVIGIWIIGGVIMIICIIFLAPKIISALSDAAADNPELTKMAVKAGATYANPSMGMMLGGNKITNQINIMINNIRKFIVNNKWILLFIIILLVFIKCKKCNKNYNESIKKIIMT
jgi:hypothetical protein